MQVVTGVAVNFKLAVEVESDPRKREWLRAFSKPELLFDDVTAFGDDHGESVNHMTGNPATLPASLGFFNFGFSCKDFSSLNNGSREWAPGCLASGQGSTGATWKGNLDIVDATRPFVLLAENVAAAGRGKPFEQMVADLFDRGYTLFKCLMNAANYGLPQDRVRSWFGAIRSDLLSPDVDNDLCGLIELMQIKDPLPLDRFLLAPDSDYLRSVMEARLQASEKKTKALAKAKVKPRFTLKSKQKGRKWVADHWRVRRLLDMPVHSSTQPPHITEAAHKNAMCPRESDLLSIVLEGPSRPDAVKSPTLELKHSAPRVVGLGGQAKKRRFQGSTSCLLPTSRMVVMPPSVPEMRYLTGREALAIQGIECGSGHGLTDSELLHLAGNAFSGGCFAAVFLATLVHLDITRL